MTALSLADFIASGPVLGSIVRFSDGTPRPPERFRKKLAEWQNMNGSGRLIEILSDPVPYAHGRIPARCITLETGRSSIMTMVISFGVTDARPLRFETLSTPSKGCALVVHRGAGGKISLDEAQDGSAIFSGHEEAEIHLRRKDAPERFFIQIVGEANAPLPSTA